MGSSGGRRQDEPLDRRETLIDRRETLIDRRETLIDLAQGDLDGVETAIERLHRGAHAAQVGAHVTHVGPHAADKGDHDGDHGEAGTHAGADGRLGVAAHNRQYSIPPAHLPMSGRSRADAAAGQYATAHPSRRRSAPAWRRPAIWSTSTAWAPPNSAVHPLRACTV